MVHQRSAIMFRKLLSLFSSRLNAYTLLSYRNHNFYFACNHFAVNCCFIVCQGIANKFVRLCGRSFRYENKCSLYTTISPRLMTPAEPNKAMEDLGTSTLFKNRSPM